MSDDRERRVDATLVRIPGKLQWTYRMSSDSFGAAK